MQNILNSSPLLLKKNSFLDVKPLKNETQEIKAQSNIFLKKDKSVSFSQINESQVVQSDEIQTKIFGKIPTIYEMISQKIQLFLCF